MSDYRPGDIVNGHVLGADLQWHPIQGPPPSADATQVFDTTPQTQVIPAAYLGDAGGSSGNGGHPRSGGGRPQRIHEPPPRGGHTGLKVAGALAAVAVVLTAAVIAIAQNIGGRDADPVATSSAVPAPTSAWTSEKPTPSETSDPPEPSTSSSTSTSSTTSSSSGDEETEPPPDGVSVGGRKAEGLSVRSLRGDDNRLGLFAPTVRVHNTGGTDRTWITMKVVAVRDDEVIATATGIIQSISAGQTITTRPLSGDEFPPDDDGITYELSFD